MPEDLKIVEQNPGTRTTLESIPEPIGNFAKDFVKYSFPGVLTKEELEAVTEKLGRLYDYAKQRDYRRVAGTSLQVLGHALMASVGLVPFAGGFKPIITGITSSGRSAVSKSATVAKNGLTTAAPKAKVQFTAPDLLEQANVRLRRTLTNKEYQEALSKQFPNDADMLLSGQLKEANKSVITPSFPENPLSLMITNSKYVTLGGYKLSFSDWESLVAKLIEKNGLNLSVEQYAKNYLGVSDDLWKTISTNKPEISLNKEAYNALKN